MHRNVELALGGIICGILSWLVWPEAFVQMSELVVLGLGLGLLLVLPFLLTRACLSAAANRWIDPHIPEAASEVHRAASGCLAVTIVSGLIFSAWCYSSSIAYQPDPWLDSGAQLWGMACFLPLGALVGVVAAIWDSVRPPVRNGPGDLGFHRW